MKFFEYQIQGREGLDLLQRISASDFRLVCSRRPGLILNSSGKIRSFFEYAVLDSEAAQIWIPFSKDDLARKVFLECLDQYTFSEKYKITEGPVSESQLNTDDFVLKRKPRIDFEFKTDEKTSPLDIGLNLAIADQKGCYPGQEVIEKIVAIGEPPKRLCLLEVESPMKLADQDLDLFDAPPGSESAPSAIGRITSWTVNKTFALGIIRKTSAKQDKGLFTGHGCKLKVIEC